METDFYIVKKADFDYIRDELTIIKQMIAERNNSQKVEDFSNTWIESTDVRKLLGISQRTWQTYRDKGIIPFSQFGRKIYVRRSDIDAFLEKCKERPVKFR